MQDCRSRKLETGIFYGQGRIRKQSFLSFYSIFPILCWLLLSHASSTHAEQPSEYRLKLAFLYNFVAFTEWPSLPNQALNLCIYGEDPFGEQVEHIRQRKIDAHNIFIKYPKNISELTDCQIVFITRSVMEKLDSIIKQLEEMPILTIADTPGAGRQGVMLNMAIKEGKIIFEANLAMAKRNGLKLNSQLLRFASEVYQ